MNTEIEVRFLDINVVALKNKLKELGAEDLGEDLFDEVVYYDKDNTWQTQQKVVRVRKSNRGITVSFKHHHSHTVDGANEAEFSTDDYAGVQSFLEALGFLQRKRHQQKKRHTYVLDGVHVDIDTWPNIPTYVELEGASEESLKQVAEKLGFDWDKADMTSAADIIKSYGIPVKELSLYTFEKIE
jgi:adenylate cyclase, class 2